MTQNKCTRCGKPMTDDECAGFRFAIVDEDGSWVAGSITPTKNYQGQFAYPLVMGTESERELYPTRGAALLELGRTCSLGSFRIVVV